MNPLRLFTESWVSISRSILAAEAERQKLEWENPALARPWFTGATKVAVYFLLLVPVGYRILAIGIALLGYGPVMLAMAGAQELVLLMASISPAVEFLVSHQGETALRFLLLGHVLSVALLGNAVSLVGLTVLVLWTRVRLAVSSRSYVGSIGAMNLLLAGLGTMGFSLAIMFFRPLFENPGRSMSALFSSGAAPLLVSSFSMFFVGGAFGALISLLQLAGRHEASKADSNRP